MSIRPQRPQNLDELKKLRKEVIKTSTRINFQKLTVFGRQPKKQDQNWIDPQLAGLQIIGILHKIEANEMIKL